LQHLRDEVRNAIIAAALDEFLAKGYRNSSMRVIARNAGIVMGNIYHYFKNKDELFNELVGSVHDQVTSISQQICDEMAQREGPWEDKQAMVLVQQMCNHILETFAGHRTELLILLDKSEGSRYANTKQEMILQIEQILKARLIPEMKMKDSAAKNPYILYVTASAFVEGVCIILRSCQDHSQQEALISSLTNIMLWQISQRI
jgi:AcrR family transcriptional regulator